MVIRVVRVLVGVVSILVALPLLLGGVVLWAAMQHRADDGSFTAPLAPMRTTGYAVVVPDVDALLREEAPFVRGGRTTLRFTAGTSAGPAFIGLAPRAAVERYLGGVPHATVSQVRLARGGLPVTLSAVAGTARPAAAPGDQSFWLVSSASGTLFWSPSGLRGEQLSLVVMSPTGAAPGEVRASAAMLPRWLDPTTYGLLILGTVAFLIGMVLLFWPRRHREIVYVVEPSQVPEIAARLGISTEPLAAALGGTEPGPPSEPEPEPGPAVEPPAWLVEPDRIGAPPAQPAPPVQPGPPVPPAQPVLPVLGDLASGGVALGAAGLPIWNGPTPLPVPTGQPGMYRSFTAPPPITPSFVWPPVTEPAAGRAGPASTAGTSC
ncbi:MAG: hypothetical protein AUI10_05095 [Actinobacteria bacterium 13_2_20CM_2_72_6]|nr:MAG: hypothetical protein AUI10_05095 [Actinobacteria bacterium 13_2_20CM_2_72_6]